MIKLIPKHQSGDKIKQMKATISGSTGKPVNAPDTATAKQTTTGFNPYSGSMTTVPAGMGGSYIGGTVNNFMNKVIREQVNPANLKRIQGIQSKVSNITGQLEKEIARRRSAKEPMLTPTEQLEWYHRDPEVKELFTARSPELHGDLQGRGFVIEQKKPETTVAGFKKGGLIPKNKKGGKKWIQKAVNPAHKGYCTPVTKKTCTPARKAFAMTMKKHHGFHKK